MTKWISVGEKLPEVGEKVLCFYVTAPKDSCLIGVIKKDQNIYYWHIVEINEHDPGFGSVTHWMPLPDAPEKEIE